MNVKSNRLFFIDAIRAWAILMMLQGHFIDGLLAPTFRDPNNFFYATWLYFRGITAPVFFTVSGFIFTFLLIRVPEKGWDNPRVKKGIRRGLQLLVIGYALRMNMMGLLKGEVYASFFLVDVLHCIGLSLLAIISVYLLTANKKSFYFPATLLVITLLLFLFEPIYTEWQFSFLPAGIANYFTKVNDSVFTIIPWLGYATVGGFISLLFAKYQKATNLYLVAISISAIVGLLLIYTSSAVFLWLNELTGIQLFKLVEENNYLFIRLGDVFMVLATFMLLRSALTGKTVLIIGASTLSIYVIHFVILYGSFTSLGLYRFFHHALAPSIVIPGAILFMVVCTFLALQYNKHETNIKYHLNLVLLFVQDQLFYLAKITMPVLKEVYFRVRVFVQRLLGIATK